MAQAPAHNFITAFEDSRRWRHVRRRPGDIVIGTPPKSGTTWMQGIVTALLWPDEDRPEPRSQLSPWIDACVVPLEALVEQVDSQEHRRYFKTHSPGDCTPFDQRCRYIVVYRDGRDSLVSWGNHRATMRPQVVRAMNTGAESRGAQPVAEEWHGDYDVLFDEWQTICSPVRHLASWWPRRHAENVLFVHYADLSHDLRHEMERVATFLGLDIEESKWPAVVARCTLDSMRTEAENRGGMDRGFKGGAAAFFYKGTSGRWRELLTDAQVQRYQDVVNEGLPNDAAAWLEHGSHELAVRPNDIGEAAAPLATGTGNPMGWLIRRQHNNSIHAIAERHVDQAREDGLFDNLPLHGKPIPDIDQQRPAGWWAKRFVQNERNKVTALTLEGELRAAMPALWRLETADQVRSRVVELNADIESYNRVTTLAPMDLLDIDGTLATWSELRSR